MMGILQATTQQTQFHPSFRTANPSPCPKHGTYAPVNRPEGWPVCKSESYEQHQTGHAYGQAIWLVGICFQIPPCGLEKGEGYTPDMSERTACVLLLEPISVQRSSPVSDWPTRPTLQTCHFDPARTLGGHTSDKSARCSHHTPLQRAKVLQACL